MDRYKTIDKVRPGGVMMLVTSRYTMDKATDKARAYLRSKGDFLGAIRLPQTAFKENAGTDVVTDVIFLKKREPGTRPGGIPWNELKTVAVKDKDGNKHNFEINKYFADHPEMILGNNSAEGSMYGSNQYTVTPKRGDIGASFLEAIKNLPENIYTHGSEKTETETVEADFAPSIIKESGFFVNDKGKLLQKENGVGVPVKAAGKKEKQIKAFVSLRDAVRNVLYVQMQETEETLEEAQAKMDKEYQAFVKEFGPLNKRTKVTRTLKDGSESISYRYPNLQPVKSDPDAYLVMSIEKFDDETEEVKKADIFSKRVIAPEVEPQIESVTDALHVTLYRTGRVDIPMIADMAGMSEEEAISGLGSVIYYDPDGRKWVTDDDYLSGNVRKKLTNAKAAAALDEKFQRNVQALEKVQPEDLPIARIKISLGMPIISEEDVSEFADEVLDIGLEISHYRESGNWSLVAHRGQGGVTATSEYGTGRKNAVDLLEAALNNKPVTVRDTDSSGKSQINRVETDAAIAKMQRIIDKFSDWVWTDATRSDTLFRKFNDEYNNTVKREYGGDHIKVMTFPGLSSTVNPYDHQRRVAYRIVQNGNTYMAHSVGAGKTIASILAGMELKRLGLKKKPVWVVPNHMLKQFSNEFLQLYPAAKLLVAEEENFKGENRNRFMGKVAAENWDGVIITHSAFMKIPMSPDFRAAFIRDQIDEAKALKASSEGDNLKVKQIERMVKRLQQRLEKIMAAGDRDSGVSFEETGIDQIFVDEAHEFRKLDFVTEQAGIKGIDPDGSLKAFDLYTKIQYLEGLTPGRTTVLMSGTPITNTLGEVFTIQRYLQGPRLEELGLHNFDAWASTFGRTVSSLEATAGTYKMVSRFGQFKNMVPLTNMWAEIGDTVHARDLDYISRPKVHGDKRQMVVTEASALQQEYKRALGRRIEAIERRRGQAKKGDDIILSVITDGRHAAMDDRYINPDLPVAPDSKMSLMTDKVAGIWKETSHKKSTQMIFADLGVPGSEERRGFSAYKSIKEELIKRGIPANEIAFMQDYKKSDEKTKLFRAMNRGNIRVLIGSSQAMGTGVNAQKKLVALHHFDPDSYLPSNIEQREGRIVRQGNENDTVHLYAYTNRGSHDETMWQFLESKQRFIDQFLAGDAGEDEVSDIDGSADSFAEARALSSDNPLVLELAGVENETSKLESLRIAHIGDQRRLVSSKGQAQADISTAGALLAKLEESAANAIDTSGNKFRMDVDGKTYTKRKTAGDTLVNKIKAVFAGDVLFHDRYKVGSLGGFDIVVREFGLGSRDKALRVSVYDPQAAVTIGSSDVIYKGSVDELDGVGLVRQLENKSGGIPKAISNIKSQMDKHRKVIAEAEARIGQPFEYEQAYRDKRARAEEIRAELESQGGNQGEELTEEDRVNVEDYTGDDDGQPRMSVAQSAPLPIENRADVFGEISKKIGKGGLGRLIRKGVLEIVSPERAEQILSMVGGAKFSVVESPKGGKNYGVIPKQIAKDISRQPGFIQLKEGDEKTGKIHIDEKHLRQFKQHGLTSSEDFVQDVAENYNEIRKGNAGSLILVKRNGNNKIAYIKLEPSSTEDVYFVKSATFAEVRYLKNKELLWEGAPSLHALADTPLNAFSRGQNNLYADNISQKGIEVKKSEDGSRIEGFTLNGKAYLVDGNIAKGQAMAVLNHELGVHLRHIGFTRSRDFQSVLRLLERRANNPRHKDHAAIRMAMSRVPAGTREEHKPEETLAYLVTKSPQTNIVQRLLAAIKKFLIEKLGFTPRILRNIDLAALAQSAVRRESSQRISPYSRESSTFMASMSKNLGVPRAQLEKEYNAVRNRFLNTPDWMQAPNGKPTNLNERQWVMVRTPRFKAWFGNWEIDRNKEIPVEVIAERRFDGDRKKAQAWIEGDGRFIMGEHENKESGMLIHVSPRNIMRKATSGDTVIKSGTGDHYEVLRYLPQIIKQSSLVSAEPDRNNSPNILGVYKFVAPVRIGDNDYTVKLTVKDQTHKERSETTRQDKFYTHELVEIEMPQTRLLGWDKSRSRKAHGISANIGKGEITEDSIVTIRNKSQAATRASGIPSTYTVGEMVDVVNAKEDNAISEASKVLDDNGEPLVVYHGSAELNITEFIPSEDTNLIFFTPEKSLADEFAEIREADSIADWVYQSNVLGCLLNILPQRIWGLHQRRGMSSISHM